MAYNFKINTDKILKEIVKILSMQKKYNDDKLNEKDVITMTNLLINLGANVPLEEEMSLKDKLAFDIGLINTYSKSYKIIKYLYNNISTDSYVPNYITCIISNHDALEEAYCFFSKYGNFFSKPLNSLRKDLFSHLEFSDDAINSESYFMTNKEAFIIVKNYKNICKFTNLVHELQHYIDNYNNAFFRQNYLIREIAAIFMEILSTDYISRVTNLLNEGNKRKKELHSIISVTAFNLYYKTQLLNIAKRNMYKDATEITKLLKDKLHITEEGIDILTRTTLDEDYMYEIAYLIAIELYKVYKEDEEKAIYILKNIIMYGNNDNICDLLNMYGIRICQNVMRYEKKLII